MLLLILPYLVNKKIMQLIEVTDKVTRKKFHAVPHLIYKNDPNWACPLEGMVEDIFTPGKNKAFKNGKAIRWILVDENQKPIGRIAAFINLILLTLTNSLPAVVAFLNVLITRKPPTCYLMLLQNGTKPTGWKPWMDQ